MTVVTRDYRADDLGQVVELGRQAATDLGGLTVDQLLDLLEHGRAVVADADGTLVGALVGAVLAGIGWIYPVGLPSGVDRELITEQLLAVLETRLVEAGARKLSVLVPPAAELASVLSRREYRQSKDVRYFEREVAAVAVSEGVLAELGGTMIGAGLWDELKGMEEAKEIIERRVILPLEEPTLADKHGVVTPRAVVLFGPPGTGKTTFAKGIASRLRWPFVEILPAELAGEGPERQAKLLADTFARVLELPSAVVFVDEVEDLAATRHEERRVSPSITNEFLKQIPRLREPPRHLLACATNWVAQLDAAFLRPGRFDYVLPVGPPNEDARRSIWHRYVAEVTDERVDLSALVTASELFTPADIEFAARKAAQRAFEREHFENVRHRARTEDFLAAIADTKPTLTAEIVSGFDEDTRRFARF